MKSQLVDLEVFVHHETDKAILVSLDSDSERIWLPKSRVEIGEYQGIRRGVVMAPRIVDVTLPESLATEKGLI